MYTLTLTLSDEHKSEDSSSGLKAVDALLCTTSKIVVKIIKITENAKMKYAINKATPIP